jgi:hypothetical protein
MVTLLNQITIIMMTQEQVAERLLWPLWRCVTEDYKSRYKREVWDHFENAVRSAAYTGQMRTYLTNFQGRIPCDFQSQYMKDILSVVDSGCDDDILNWLRDETTYLVMLVRIRNQERKEAMSAGETDVPASAAIYPEDIDLESVMDNQ